jgi:hypothetical protein
MQQSHSEAQQAHSQLLKEAVDQSLDQSLGELVISLSLFQQHLE